MGREMREEFTSNAQWPKGQYPFGNDISTDWHMGRASAQAVCDALEAEGWDGEGKIFPIRTWVEPTNA